MAKKPKKKPEIEEEILIEEDDNNIEDLPRGLQIDTTTNSSGTTRNFSMGGDVTVGKGSDYIKDLID
jgi:hypothetical protein